MKRIVILFFFGILLCSFSFFQHQSTEDRTATITEIVHGVFENNYKEFITKLKLLKSIISLEKVDSASIAEAQQVFIDCRLLYKKNEVFTVYLYPSTDQNFNGPVVSEVEYEDEPKQMIVAPTGLQVIESYLWSDDFQVHQQDLHSQIEKLIEIYSVTSLGLLSKNINERQLIEAIQSEVNRHFSLGIALFDTPDSKNALNEIIASLNTIKAVLSFIYVDDSSAPVKKVLGQFNISLNYLNGIVSLDKMDYLNCLRICYVPLSTAIGNYLSELPENNFKQTTALRKNQHSIFDREGFNSYFYNPRGENKNYTFKVAELGRLLFFDPVLSSNNQRACASCHRPELAFTDHLPTSVGFHSGRSLSRNAPSLLNVALQRNYFWDSRSTDLEDQIGHVLNNENEMMSSYDEIRKKLNQSEEYKILFSKAFQGTEDSVITNFSISNAIAEYERQLTSLNSRFDKNVRGEENDFTDEEKFGFNTFMLKANCGSCHYLPMFSGLVPPNYTKSEFENIGTTMNGNLKSPILDTDQGRGKKYQTKLFMGSFKTPTLRNIKLTKPYMHNGGFETLEEVIDFYNEGGGEGLGLSVANQTLSSHKLNLTSEEKKSLITFLTTLTDTIGTTQRPTSLPMFPERMGLSGRKIGGEY